MNLEYRIVKKPDGRFFVLTKTKLWLLSFWSYCPVRFERLGHALHWIKSQNADVGIEVMPWTK